MNDHRKFSKGASYEEIDYNELKRTVILKIGLLFVLSIALAFMVAAMIPSEYQIYRVCAVVLTLIVSLLIIRIGIIEYAHIMRRQKAAQSHHLTDDR